MEGVRGGAKRLPLSLVHVISWAVLWQGTYCRALPVGSRYFARDGVRAVSELEGLVSAHTARGSEFLPTAKRGAYWARAVSGWGLTKCLSLSLCVSLSVVRLSGYGQP